MNDTEPVKTNAALLLVAWAIVLVPTGWGLSYTIQNAIKLFTAPPAATSSAPATTAPTSGSAAAKP